MGELTGQVVLVTGAGRGIGAASARALAARGAALVLNDLDGPALEAAAARLRDDGTDVRTIVADVASPAEAAEVIAQALQWRGRIDALVNNVGGSGTRARPTPRWLQETTWDDMLAVFHSNVAATFCCTRAAVPAMRERRYGRIVNVASLAGRSRSALGGPAYAAAKAAIIGFTRHTSAELATDNVTINAVAPGLVFTDRVRERVEQRAPDEQQRLIGAIPLGRAAQPEEPAAAIAFLCTPAAGYITGAVLDVNGGIWVG